MVVFFTEQDLVSFGNYMISAERAKPYLENPIIKDKVGEYLSQVNNYDLELWTKKSMIKIEDQQPASTKPTTVEEIPVDEDNNTLNIENNESTSN